MGACGGGGRPVNAPLKDVRAEGRTSTDPDTVGKWALAEAIAPSGTGASTLEAEKRLSQLGGTGIYASLARGVLSEVHGAPKTAAAAYVEMLRAAQASSDPSAPLASWFAVHHLRALRGSVTGLWDTNRATLEALRAQPGAIGWRTAAELADWSTAEAFEKGALRGKAYDDLVVGSSGCAKGIRIAGPFGRGTAPDRRRSFDAERPGPWPPAWAPDPMRGSVPAIRKVQQPRCLAASTERVPQGVFYAETFFTTAGPRDVVLAVQGAVAVWVDDAPVLTRDLREWGVWQRFGTAVHVGAGRHRVLARLIDDTTAVRILDLDGRPAGVETDGDASRGYSVVPAVKLADPNPLAEVVRTRDPSTNLERWLSAALAQVEGLPDVAAVLLEPFISPEDAAPLALDLAAAGARADPLYPDDVRHRNEKELRARAVRRDPRLWASRAWLAYEEAGQKGLFEGVAPLKDLTTEFPEAPAIQQGLAHLYGRLGWKAERMQTLSALAKKFPDDVASLKEYLEALEEDGNVADADAVAERIRRLDADSELDLERAIARHDWKTAIAELEKVQARRPERKDIAGRIASVLARSGDPSAAATQLGKALAKHPEDSASRFRLADIAYAGGDRKALRQALADALQAGGTTTAMRSAIDLLEGATDFEPYRQDSKKVIAEYEAWERGGHHMDGIAARVLDYAAVWVHPDGSSEMLEHEIQKLQSQEAIGKEAEQQVPEGLVLRVRVIKPDGRTLEPDPVAGKPTLTMPHLEVGDYVEIEHVVPQNGDGEKGRRYRGPHWFFREADKGYWRSEFVCLAPKDKPIEVETRGNVPAPTTRTTATVVERRWRVDLSPPVPTEPESAPPQEYLPSVRMGWGISLAETLEKLVDYASDETPLDPRLKAYAEEIVRGVPETNADERVRRVYRAVLERIQDGSESDGRRVITGKSGSRQAAFVHLLKQLGIPVDVALVKDRLAIPALGKMSEVENWDAFILRVDTHAKATPASDALWLTVRDKFAPFGYVPAEVRGQPAYVLVPGTPKAVIPPSGAADGIAFEGRADVHDDGSASVDLAIHYMGKLAISMRNVFDKVPEAQVRDFVEGRLLARNLPAPRVKSFSIEHKTDLDAPLVVRVKAELPQLVKPAGARMVLLPVFPIHVAQIATLPERQTPLLLSSSSHVEVRFDVVLPTSWKVPDKLPAGDARDGERSAIVKDSISGHSIRLDRVVDVPAGRVQPGAEYAKLLKFAQDADAMIEREIVLAK
jgi:tetratricopeptide (TPR) repeat protein